MDSTTQFETGIQLAERLRFQRLIPGANNWPKPPRGPNGRALCRWCGAEVPPRQRAYCSEQCSEEWSIRTSASYAAILVHRRDKGVCELCGHQGRWEMDHRIPVVRGGGCCGLDNLRTLCKPCHDRETARLAAQRAAERRGNRPPRPPLAPNPHHLSLFERSR